MGERLGKVGGLYTKNLLSRANGTGDFWAPLLAGGGAGGGGGYRSVFVQLEQ